MRAVARASITPGGAAPGEDPEHAAHQEEALRAVLQASSPTGSHIPRGGTAHGPGRGPHHGPPKAMTSSRCCGKTSSAPTSCPGDECRSADEPLTIVATEE